jgi:hypothetical protein
MTLDCRGCGAPLSLSSPVDVVRCEFCGVENRVQQTAAPSPIETAQLSPEVAAEQEDKHRRVSIGCVMFTFLAFSITAPALFNLCSSVVSRTDPKDLDRVAVFRSQGELHKALGGDINGKSLYVKLKSPYELLYFGFGDEGRLENLSVKFPEDTGCSAQHNAIRQRLSQRFGTKFDGEYWRFGGATVSFERNCSTLGLSIPKDCQLGVQRREALWEVLKKDVFGLKGTMGDDAVNAAIGRGPSSQPEQVGLIISEMSLDDAMASLSSKLPGVEASSDRTSYEVPFDGKLFKGVMVTWHNRNGGKIQGLLFRATRDKSLQPASLAPCIAQHTGAKFQTQLENYAQQKVNYHFDLGEVSGEVHAGAINVWVVRKPSSAFDSAAILPGTVVTLFKAVAACDT